MIRGPNCRVAHKPSKKLKLKMVIHAVYYQSGKCAIKFTLLKKQQQKKAFLLQSGCTLVSWNLLNFNTEEALIFTARYSET